MSSRRSDRYRSTQRSTQLYSLLTVAVSCFLRRPRKVQKMTYIQGSRNINYCEPRHANLVIQATVPRASSLSFAGGWVFLAKTR